MHPSDPVSRRGDGPIRSLQSVQISPGYSPWFGLRLIANDAMSGPWPQTNKRTNEQTNKQTDAPSLNIEINIVSDNCVIRIAYQILLYPADILSRSFVMPTPAGPSGRRPPNILWRSPSRRPAVVVVTWPRHGAGSSTFYIQGRPPGRRPLWPTQTHLLHPTAPQCSDLAERVLSEPSRTEVSEILS